MYKYICSLISLFIPLPMYNLSTVIKISFDAQFVVSDGISAGKPKYPRSVCNKIQVLFA